MKNHWLERNHNNKSLYLYRFFHFYVEFSSCGFVNLFVIKFFIVQDKKVPSQSFYELRHKPFPLATDAFPDTSSKFVPDPFGVLCFG